MPRYMLTLKSDEKADFGAPPQALYEAIGTAAAEWSAAGIMLDTAGLAPTAMANRVRLAGGEITVASGPFTDDAPVAIAYAIVKVGSQQDAIDHAIAFLELYKQHWPGWEGESEVRQTFGADDSGPAT